MAFFDELHEVLLGETALNAQRVCEVLAEHWGGERVYVPKRCDQVEITQRDTPQTLIRRGVKRTTAYRWVNNWRD